MTKKWASLLSAEPHLMSPIHTNTYLTYYILQHLCNRGLRYGAGNVRRFRHARDFYFMPQPGLLRYTRTVPAEFLVKHLKSTSAAAGRSRRNPAASTTIERGLQRISGWIMKRRSVFRRNLRHRLIAVAGFASLKSETNYDVVCWGSTTLVLVGFDVMVSFICYVHDGSWHWKWRIPLYVPAIWFMEVYMGSEVT